MARYVLAFTAACTVAVFWEFGEFASDLVLGTHIQHDVAETLWDLVFGAGGAAIALCVITIFEAIRPRYSKPNQTPAPRAPNDGGSS